MKQVILRIVGIGFLLCVMQVSSAYGWIDVNKYWDSIPEGVENNTSDYLMCWAAAASNVLTYTGWGIDDPATPYTTEYDVYHEFLEAFPNSGGYGSLAYSSYFQWHYPNVNWEDYYVQVLQDDDDENYIIEQYTDLLINGYGVYLSLASNRGGHAVTGWEFSWDYDPYFDNYDDVSFTITDSDDYYTGDQEYDLYLGLWNRWNFMDYGQTSYYLRRIEALAMRPDNILVFQPGNPLPVLRPISGLIAVNPIIATPIGNYLEPHYQLAQQEPDGPGSPGAIVPEPVSLLLFLTGLSGFVLTGKIFVK